MSTPVSTRARTSRSRLAERWRRLSLGCKVASLMLIVFVLTATFGGWILPYSADSTAVQDRLLPPLSKLESGSLAPLGTDQLGRDMLAQLIAGSRISLIVGLGTVLLGGLIGLIVGTVAGYFGGAVDAVIGRIVDIQLAFPSILLAILLAGALGPGVLNVILALAVSRWVIFARVTRANAITTKNLEYVSAAQVLGIGTPRILAVHIAPSSVQPMIVVATAQISLAMVAEASLSYLGLGVPVSLASWGSTIADGGDYLGSAWWIATFPGIVLTAVVVCIGIIGDEMQSMSGLSGSGEAL